MRLRDIKQRIEDGDWECNYSFKTLVDFIETSKTEGLFGSGIPLQMNPDFQRGHVWTEEQQVKYIEAVISGGAKNARVIYLNDPTMANYIGYNDAVCVDGLQRYTAIYNFMNDRIKAFGLFHSEFEDTKQFGRQHIMRVNINKLQTKQEVLEWYIEMNEGGTPRTKEEIDRVKELLKQQ